MKNNPEEKFEKELFKEAGLLYSRYIKIPDISKKNFTIGIKNTDSKRPFDGVLITPGGNFCIECKYNYNTLMRHQELNQMRINNINKSFFVLRKVELKKGFEYRIEQNHEVLFKTDKIEQLIRWFLI